MDNPMEPTPQAEMRCTKCGKGMGSGRSDGRPVCDECAKKARAAHLGMMQG